MIDSDIYIALADNLASASLGYDIAWPNVNYPTSGSTKAETYLRVDHMPNESITYAVGKDCGLRQGLFQVSVIYQHSSGIVGPYDLAGAVLALYPKSKKLYSGDAKVIINRVPWASGPIVDDAETIIPITISYEAYAI